MQQQPYQMFNCQMLLKFVLVDENIARAVSALSVAVGQGEVVVERGVDRRPRELLLAQRTLPPTRHSCNKEKNICVIAMKFRKAWSSIKDAMVSILFVPPPKKKKIKKIKKKIRTTPD